jgi:hypothetical protein
MNEIQILQEAEKAKVSQLLIILDKVDFYLILES